MWAKGNGPSDKPAVPVALGADNNLSADARCCNVEVSRTTAEVERDEELTVAVATKKRQDVTRVLDRRLCDDLKR